MMGASTMSKTLTVSVRGLDTEIVTVETDLTVGLPAFSLVGLPGSAVRESKERVHAAVVNSGYEFPLKRITVNLSPADTRKDGSHFDLPIAVGVLAAGARGKAAQELPRTAFIGELSLDGAVRRVECAAAMALGLQEAGVTRLFLPEGNLPDVAPLPGMLLFPVSELSEAVGHMLGERLVECVRGGTGAWAAGAAIHGGAGGAAGQGAAAVGGAGGGAQGPGQGAGQWMPECGDFSEVRGQEHVKRALLIAVAGGHDISLVGPPGIGKSMLARRVPGIMSPLPEAEAREVTKIHNIAGEMNGRTGLLRTRPFRAPHHSATSVSIIGGGHRLQPGEVSLAHRGVLFLDELPEFDRRTLDMLRQPLEDRFVDLSRARSKGRYPCDFLLICAMNPCPCGYHDDPSRTCVCSEGARHKYSAKVSGPLLDRIDIHVRMSAVGEEHFAPPGDGAPGESCLSTSVMREAVARAEAMQRERNMPGQGGAGGVPGAIGAAGGAGAVGAAGALGEAGADVAPAAPLLRNGRLSGESIFRLCVMDAEAESLLNAAYTRYAISVRARTKIIKVARTIADIDGAKAIARHHIAEAIAYRIPSNGR